jgi:hypothetical protein
VRDPHLGCDRGSHGFLVQSGCRSLISPFALPHASLECHSELRQVGGRVKQYGVGEFRFERGVPQPLPLILIPSHPFDLDRLVLNRYKHSCDLCLKKSPSRKLAHQVIIRDLARLVYCTPSDRMDRLRALEIAPPAPPWDNCQVPLTLVNDGWHVSNRRLERGM